MDVTNNTEKKIDWSTWTATGRTEGIYNGNTI